MLTVFEVVWERDDGRIITYKYWDDEQAWNVYNSMKVDPYVVECHFYEVRIRENRKLIEKYERPRQDLGIG